MSHETNNSLLSHLVEIDLFRSVCPFLGSPEENNLKCIPAAAESLAQINPACFAAAFNGLIYSAEKKRGRSLIRHISTVLNASPPHAKEPHLSATLIALEALDQTPI